MLVLGSGVAGIACALAAADQGVEVTLATPGTFDLERGIADAEAGGSTALAQGGIAAAIGPDDTPELHAADTVAAGAGIVDAEAAAELTRGGAAAVSALLAIGFPADRHPAGARVGEVSFGLEAAHGRARIVHAGEDRTGASLHAFLSARLRAYVVDGRVRIAPRTSAVSLLESGGSVCGAVLRGENGELSVMRATSVVLATGGYAAMYSRSSNAASSRGEGIVLAARAGAVLADLEFVQFHPTVLAGTGFLISEAVRGAGAVLRDAAGHRFMIDAHEAAELAPRDVVSRVAQRVMRDRTASEVWLDASGIEAAQGAGTLERRFPALTAATRARGYDWAKEPIPVAPAAHYTMGGVVTDLDGRTSIPGLFAAGEVACTGVHGANRLASNSLLEGLAFGANAGRAAAEYSRGSEGSALEWRMRGAAAARLIGRAESLPAPVSSDAPKFVPAERGTDWLTGDGEAAARVNAVSEISIRELASRDLGIERDAAGLSRVISAAERPGGGTLAELAAMVAQAAAARTESRGAHQRLEFPETDPAQQRRIAWRRPARSSAVRVPAGADPSNQNDSDQWRLYAC